MLSARAATAPFLGPPPALWTPQVSRGARGRPQGSQHVRKTENYEKKREALCEMSVVDHPYLGPTDRKCGKRRRLPFKERRETLIARTFDERPVSLAVAANRHVEDKSEKTRRSID